jgi:RNA polymerase sigma-70 factor, ECF subfamily
MINPAIVAYANCMMSFGSCWMVGDLAPRYNVKLDLDKEDRTMSSEVKDAPETLESYRPLLFAIAYQMTGSASEAEDLVQETYLRFQQAQSQVKIASLKSFLTTIIVHLSVDYLKSSRHQRERYVGMWLPEPVLTADANPLPGEIVERQEAVSMAFLILLETLTPPERAVFLLREVFDFPYETIATIVDKSVAACRQIFHRAQRHLAAKQRPFEVRNETHQSLVTHFLAASQQGDFDALLRDLAEDVTLYGDGGGKATVVPHPLHGAELVARFFAVIARKLPANARVAQSEANGMPALLGWEDDVLTTVFLFEINNGRLVNIYSQRNPDKLIYLQGQLSQH